MGGHYSDDPQAGHSSRAAPYALILQQPTDCTFLPGRWDYVVKGVSASIAETCEV